MDSHVTTEYGKQNIFAKEAKPYIDEEYKGYIVEAEQLNGRLAMIGIIALLGSYITTGQIIPAIW
tara:strand:- start:2557 stop:2751 length:195 start_codon:yes stop_codon:yes gene_type:complete